MKQEMQSVRDTINDEDKRIFAIFDAETNAYLHVVTPEKEKTAEEMRREE